MPSQQQSACRIRSLQPQSARFACEQSVSLIASANFSCSIACVHSSRMNAHPAGLLCGFSANLIAVGDPWGTLGPEDRRHITFRLRMHVLMWTV